MRHSRALPWMISCGLAVLCLGAWLTLLFRICILGGLDHLWQPGAHAPRGSHLQSAPNHVLGFMSVSGTPHRPASSLHLPRWGSLQLVPGSQHTSMTDVKSRLSATARSDPNTAHLLGSTYQQMALPPLLVLVTGAAGFIGFHTCVALSQQPGVLVLGLDSFAPDNLQHKKDRQEELQRCCGVEVVHGNIQNVSLLEDLFRQWNFTAVVHLAAHAGVSRSVTHPDDYITNNIHGTQRLLQVMVHQKHAHGLLPALVYASSSSVYGGAMAKERCADTAHTPQQQTMRSRDQPVGPNQGASQAAISHRSIHLMGRAGQGGSLVLPTTTASNWASAALAHQQGQQTCCQQLGSSTELMSLAPASVYAASKLATEHLVQVYHRQYGLAAAGLRFFTVYGPWGRPDMAMLQFMTKLQQRQTITLYCQPHMHMCPLQEGVPVLPMAHGAQSIGPLSTQPAPVSQDGTSGYLSLSHSQQTMPTPTYCMPVMRDFTYISDIIQGVMHALSYVLESNAVPHEQHRVFNLGAGRPRPVTDVLNLLEQATGITAHHVQLEPLGSHSPDPWATWSDNSAAIEALGYHPIVALEQGIREFVAWYNKYVKQP